MTNTRNESTPHEPLPLFRSEAVSARRPRALGEILLVQPPSFAVLTTVFGTVATAVVALLALASYTEHTTLHGQLVPDKGLLAVRAAQGGTIVARHIDEGRQVEHGDVLFEISGERISSALGATETNVSGAIVRRAESLAAQAIQLHALEAIERASLEDALRALRDDAGLLRTMRAEQAARVELAETMAARYQTLAAEGFVPDEHATLRREDMLEQRARLHGLDREQEHALRQINETEGRLDELDPRYASQRAELDRAQAATRQEHSESEARRRYRVTAPAEGTATAVLGELGQSLDAGSLLASLVPAGSRLVAKLYAPSRAVGFIASGDRVQLRYAAYPYQKFGHHPGTVVAISEAPLSSAAQGADSEPLYLVTVVLDAQTVTAFGEPRPLRTGMIVEADVLGVTRRLYEWVLEPLYTLSGKLHD